MGFNMGCNYVLTVVLIIGFYWIDLNGLTLKLENKRYYWHFFNCRMMTSRSLTLSFSACKLITRL